MSIKFNCLNPDCRQRVEVDDAMAGKAIQCPSCSTSLRVPSSQNIKFNCSSPSCGQHIVVDVSEAGRFLKCPSCGKALQIPGALQKTPTPVQKASTQSLPIQKTAERPVKTCSSQPEPALTARGLARLTKRRLPVVNLLFTPLGRLLCGWSLGMGIVLILTTAFNSLSQIGLPPHMDGMLDEIYHHGIGEFRNTSAQVFGTRMFFLQYVGEDVNVLCLNLRTLKETQITTIKTVSSDMGFVWLGFLPDGQHFAYCARGESKHGQSFFLGDATNNIPERFLLNSKTKRPKSKVTDGFWLSDRSLILKRDDGGVYILNVRTNLLLGRLGVKGLTKLFSLTNSNQDVTFVSSHSIAYVKKGSIWNYELLDGRASKIGDLGKGIFSDLNYSPMNRRFLITRKVSADAEDSDIYEYNPATQALNLIRQHAFGGQWMQDGKACAFFEVANGKRVLDIRTAGGVFLTNLFSAGAERLRAFMVGSDGNSVYVISEDDRGTTLLSKYDVGTQTYSKPYQIQGGYTYAKMTPPIEASTTNMSGERFDYYYLLPADYNPDKKYPALVDMTASSRHNHGRDIEFIANCGIFYVSPDRLGILKFGITPTEENTLAVYHALLKNPNIDPHRIYIVGESITTGMASHLVTEHPEMWRGLILVEPTVYPVFSPVAVSFPSILMSIGDSDQYNVTSHNYGRAAEFLKSACTHLVPARIYYQQNTAHAFKPKQYKATYKTMAEFILDNY